MERGGSGLRSREQGRALLMRHPVVGGALVGLAWGVSMRGWMRYISSDPEFSWGGTFFILAAAAIVGSLLGLARHRRRVGGTGWWRLSFASLLLLGAGGAVMWPSVVLGAIALARRNTRWWLPLGIAALGAQVPVIGEAVLDNGDLGTVETVVAVAWYLPMLAAEAWGFSVAFAPAIDGSPAVTRTKRAVIFAPMAALGVLFLIAAGIPGA